MGIQGVALSKRDIIHAIHEKKGIVAQAAEILNCERKVIYNWARKDPEVEEAIKAARFQSAQERIDQDEVLKEKAYLSMLALLEKGDVTSTIFTLKALANWNEKTTQDHSIVVEINNKPYGKQ